MLNTATIKPFEKPSQPEDINGLWSTLVDQIRLLAVTRAASLSHCSFDEDSEFDRGARSLRTLMSAAEIAMRMARLEQKDDALAEENAAPDISEERLNALYVDIARRTRAIECAGSTDGSPSVARNAGGRSGEQSLEGAGT